MSQVKIEYPYGRQRKLYIHHPSDSQDLDNQLYIPSYDGELAAHDGKRIKSITLEFEE